MKEDGFRTLRTENYKGNRITKIFLPFEEEKITEIAIRYDLQFGYVFHVIRAGEILPSNF